MVNAELNLAESPKDSEQWVKFDCYLSVVRWIKLKPKQASMTG